MANYSRLESFRRVPLPRLGAREVILLLEDAFKSQRLAEKLGGKIALKSDGVPFFVFEMIRGLREGQFITELPDGSYVETRVIEEIEVPSAVRDLIEARLSGLSDADRDKILASIRERVDAAREAISEENHLLSDASHPAGLARMG